MAAMNENLTKSMLNQASSEYFNSNVYVAASLYFLNQNFKNIATFLQNEGNEERNHGMQIYEYLSNRGVDVKFNFESKGILTLVFSNSRKISTNPNGRPP